MRRVAPCAALVAAVLALLQVTTGHASGTQVVIAPASTAVAPGETTTVGIQMQDVANLWAADVIISFDPALLEVEDAHLARPGVQIEPGDLFNPSYLFTARNQADKNAGIITYTVSLLNDPYYPVPPVTGSGTLAYVTFLAKSPGTSAISFVRAVLSNHYAEPIPAAVSGGSIVVSGTGVTPSPSATPTATPTRTSTPTSTVTGEPSPTATTTRTGDPTFTPTRTSRPSATRTATGVASPTRTATRVASPSRTPTCTPSPTQVPLGLEKLVLEDAALDLGWPPIAVQLPFGYKIEYVAAAGHFAEAWIQRFANAQEAQAALQEWRDGLVAEGWAVSPMLFHGFGAYASFHSQNPGSPTLPMNERALAFQGSVWIAGAYTFDDTPHNLAPDPGTVVEAVYQAGLPYNLFSDLVPRAFLPMVSRGYSPWLPTRTPTATPTGSPTRTKTPTRTPPGTPSPTWTATPSTTATDTATPTPTVSATPECTQLIVNPGFETDEAWHIVDDLDPIYPAGRSRSRGHGGSLWSMRLGSDTGYPLESWSAVEQTVEIPEEATHAQLSFYYYPVPGFETGDYIYFWVLDAASGAELRSEFWMDEPSAWNQWNLRSADLLEFAGQRITLRFGVYNDGEDGITAVYLDDVDLCVASAP